MTTDTFFVLLAEDEDRFRSVASVPDHVLASFSSDGKVGYHLTGGNYARLLAVSEAGIAYNWARFYATGQGKPYHPDDKPRDYGQMRFNASGECLDLPVHLDPIEKQICLDVVEAANIDRRFCYTLVGHESWDSQTKFGSKHRLRNILAG